MANFKIMFYMDNDSKPIIHEVPSLNTALAMKDSFLWACIDSNVSVDVFCSSLPLSYDALCYNQNASALSDNVLCTVDALWNHIYNV